MRSRVKRGNEVLLVPQTPFPGSTNIDNLYGLRVIQSCQNICLFQELSRKLQEHFVTAGKNLPQWHPREPIRL